MARDLFVHLRGPVSSVLFVIPFCKQYSIIFQYIIFKISQISKRLLSTDITRIPKIVVSNCKKKVRRSNATCEAAACSKLCELYLIIPCIPNLQNKSFALNRHVLLFIYTVTVTSNNQFVSRVTQVTRTIYCFISKGWFLFYLRPWNRTQFHIPTKKNYLDTNQQNVVQKWIIIEMNFSIYTRQQTYMHVFPSSFFKRFFCCFCLVLLLSFVYKISRGGCIQP